MPVSSFLTPKSEVVWVSSTGTVEQALERMKPNGFSAVPILDDDGRYVGTLSTSDLMWFLLDAAQPWQEYASAAPLLRVPRRLHGLAVQVDAEVRNLVAHAMNQPFVPVVDDRGRFIGLVRRRPLIEYCAGLAGVGATASSSDLPDLLRGAGG